MSQRSKYLEQAWMSSFIEHHKSSMSRAKSLEQFWVVNESLSMSNWFQQLQLGDRLLQSRGLYFDLKVA